MPVDPDAPASEQFDLTDGMTFDVDPSDIKALASDLEDAETFDAADATDETLAEYVAALKWLADAAESARKDVFESELDERVDDGEQVADLQKLSGKNTWVSDDEAAFAAVADAGEDPMQVASVSIGDLRDVLGPEADEYIGESSYSYFRRQG